MMRAVLLALSLVVAAPAFAADPVGNYAVEGTNPGGKGHYAGTVQVTKTGDTYRVVWTIQGAQTFGTGIGNSDFIAVSYGSGKETGLALYGAEGTG